MIRAHQPPLYVTSLPAGGYDGQEIYFAPDPVNQPGVVWHLRYNAAAASYRWEWIGGSDMTSTVAADEARTSTAYGDLATVGPSLTVPAAGYYQFRATANVDHRGGSQFNALVALKIGAAAVSDNDRVCQVAAPATGLGASHSVLAGRTPPPALCAANDTIKLQYRSVAAVQVYYSFRSLSARPVRIG